MVSTTETGGHCHVCRKPVKRHSGNRSNRTCSDECFRKYMSMVAKTRRREKTVGMTPHDADEYLELIERSQTCRPDEKWYYLLQARRIRERVVAHRYDG